MTARQWQPGDPLYTHGMYRDYLFNFRDEPDTENCNCGDAARWTPDNWPANGGRSLDPNVDEIGELIDWYRQHPEEPR